MTKESYHCYFIYNTDEGDGTKDEGDGTKDEGDGTNDSSLATSFVYYLDKKICGWGFKCFIEERNVLLGKSVIDEHFKILSETEKCLVIITSDLSNNNMAEFRKQSAFVYFLNKKQQHKMIPITLNIDDIGSMKELNVNAAIHIKGSNEMEWENNNILSWQRLKNV
jgi:hypothetical protein